MQRVSKYDVGRFPQKMGVTITILFYRHTWGCFALESLCYDKSVSIIYMYMYMWALSLFAGILIFLSGMIINIYSDHILRNLRKDGEKGYKIPYGQYAAIQKQFCNASLNFPVCATF